MTATEGRAIDWRLLAFWAAALAISMVARVPVEISDAGRRGIDMGVGRAVALEGASHLVVAALLPAIYWLHRRWPVTGGARNIAIHVLAVVPYSILHTLGMAALRLLWFNAIVGEAYSFPVTADRLGYEFAKDVISYTMLSGGVLVLKHLLDRKAAPAPAASPGGPLPERFAVRRRGKEIMVEVADIDWVEASGNYAVLHVGGELLEIRSSLTKLEGELDAKRFVRVHKSHLVNIARVVEVTPWVSGDWRIRLQDGAEVNLSRRYRQRFEALVPVKS
ncbi:MAG: LytTR family transcriptional regulator [Reyranella sp.]|nr:MAG: LytTR family transcriptional regulator [Reyranella sp.]